MRDLKTNEFDIIDLSVDIENKEDIWEFWEE